MKISLEKSDRETIICDNETYRLIRLTRNNSSVTFQCTKSRCNARIALNKEETKILSANFQHNHILTINQSLKKSPSNKSNSPSNNSKLSDLSKKNLNPRPKKTLNPRLSANLSESPKALNNIGNSANNSKLARKSAESKVVNSAIPTGKNKDVESKTLNITLPAASPSVNNNSTNNIHNIHNVNNNGRVDQLNIPHNTNLQNKSYQVNSSVPTKLPHRASKYPKSLIQLNRVFIFSDSMGRDLNRLLWQFCTTSCSVFSVIKPNAILSQVIESVPTLCSDFTQNDAVIIIGGTNDFSHWFPNTSKYFNLHSLKSLAGKTNVIISSVPPRFDLINGPATTVIYNSNLGLLHAAKKYGFLYFDSFSFLRRQYFTTHGLHMNRRGKLVFSLRLRNFIHDVTIAAMNEENQNLKQVPNNKSSNRLATTSSLPTMSTSPMAEIECEPFKVSTTNCSSPLTLSSDKTILIMDLTCPNLCTTEHDSSNGSSDSKFFHGPNLMDETFTSTNTGKNEFFRK